MALGYKFGHDQPGDETMRMQVLAKAREFEDRFTAQAGALECRDILGHDVSTPEGRIAALAADLFNTKCPEVIMTACGILDEMLAQA